MTAPTQAQTVRLMLVEDEDLYRDLLRIVLDQQPRLQVVGAFGDASSALQAAVGLRPHVAMLDIELRGTMNGIQLGLKLREMMPEIGIVLLSNLGDPQFLSSLPPESAGGWSYLLKKSVGDADTLTRAIEGAAERMVVLDPLMVAGMHPRPDSSVGRLTLRQREILSLIAQGMTNAAIAQRLVLAEKSVENQINLLYQHLGVDRRGGASHPRVQAALLYLQDSWFKGVGES